MAVAVLKLLLIAPLLVTLAAGPFNNFDDENEIEANQTRITDYISAGRYDDAATLSEKNLKAVEKVFGVKHGQYAKALNDLGWLMQSKGDYSRARKLFEQALAVEQARLNENDPKLATVYNNLASLVTFQGDYATAEPLYQKALKIQRASLGENHPAVAATLSNMALLMYNLDKRDEALALYQQGLTILEAKLGPNHPDVATQLGNIGAAYQAEGKLAEALAVQERALKIRETALQANDPDIAQSLTSVALLTLGSKPEEAKAKLERALTIYTKALGENHPDLISTLNELGKLAWREGHRDQAIQYFLRAARICDSHIFTTLPSLSMAEQQAFLTQQVPEELGLLLSTCRDGDSLKEAYGLIFKWKGCLIDGLSHQSALRRLSDHPQLSALARKLADVRKQSADWYYKAGTQSAEQWQAHEKELQQQKESLEREIAAKGAIATDVKDVLAGYTLASWAKVLQADEAIADVFRYQRISKDAPRSEWYSAVILTPDGNCSLVDLGLTKDVDRTIRDWRRQVLVRNEGTEQWNELATRLFTPIKTHLPATCKRLWLNPDSEASRLPWHIFAADQSLLVAQVDSSRELAKLRLEDDQPAAGAAPPNMVLAGGVHFGNDKDAKGIAKFVDLPGTLKEADAVKALAEKKNFSLTYLTGTEPTKDKILSTVPNADWVHLATHGFFIDERDLSPSRAPLLASGLVLAKADDSNANQILTAEELVAADFHKARLVTLSACETGLGEKVTGQGVLGLRASLMAAGAKCVVMSLWKVPDDATLLLMSRFYQNLWEKNYPIAEALKQAQLSVRNEPYNRFKEPVNWAGWVAVGEAW
jgi:CHAT domain-containing protein/Tfp pilus assembly protein PilF